MSRLVVLLAVLVGACSARPSAVVPPDTGYGAWGAFETQRDSMAHPAVGNASVYLFVPAGDSTNPPTLFFCHGISATQPKTYLALIKFIVSHGYAVIYTPYETTMAYANPTASYEQMWEGFSAAMEQWHPRLDTSRIGFIGHSYGGGAVPWLAHKVMVERKWGGTGAFLFIMAPWYSYNISQKQLENFPSHAKLIMQVYDDDNVNDARMAKDIFENTSIPLDEKDFVVLYSDTCGSVAMPATHGVPVGTLRFGPKVNLLDYYGVHRLLHALASYALHGDTAAQQIALGNGSDEQRFMGTCGDSNEVHPLYAGDIPRMPHPQVFYNNFWNHKINPRDSSTGGGLVHEETVRNYMRLPWYHRLLGGGDEDEEDDEKKRKEHSHAAQQREEGPCYVPQPDTGYGAEGPYEPKERLFPHPGKGDANVHVITPENAEHKLPLVLFAPALWKPSTMFYRGLIDHLVSRGNAVVFSTYNYNRFFNHEFRFRVLLEGFAAGIELIADRIDTTRIAVIGHSYGGGTVPGVTWEYVKKKKWGAGGACMFISAPWFVHSMSQEQFEEFPSDVKMLVQVYYGDRRMDRRIAQDIFYNIAIHPDNKDYITVYDAESDECEIDADHDALQSEDHDEVNVIDYYAIYRLIDALMDCAFTGSEAGCALALGNGSKRQRSMGRWRDGTPVKPLLEVTDRPSTPLPQGAFFFEWSDRQNPRRRRYDPDD